MKCDKIKDGRNAKKIRKMRFFCVENMKFVVL
jgi:hypothetical protein